MKTAREINLTKIMYIVLMGILAWQFEAPHGLSITAWHIFITFILTILAILVSAMPIGAITFTALTILVATHTLTLKESLTGFSSPISWLVLSAFFITQGFVKTALGKRIAYMLISKFGKSNIGLSYSLILTEFILSPMIPSTSARSGGIMYPISSSIAKEYDNRSISNSKFIIATSFHTNVVCCALFLTAMSGNLLIQSIAQDIGVQITWNNWAMAAVIPGIINLLLLPHITSLLIKPSNVSNLQIVNHAKKELIAKGNLNKNEITMIITFLLLLSLWIFGSYIGIDATTSAFIGLIILVVTRIIRWHDVTSESTGWETFIWFSILITLSELLAKYGVDKWIEGNIRYLIIDLNYITAITALIIIYFYGHYLFASITARVTVTYAMFLMILIDLGAPPLASAIGLAVLSNLSAGLTYYGINSAAIYFSSGYFANTEWLKIGWVVATSNLIIWIVSGAIWWKIIGWW